MEHKAQCQCGQLTVESAAQPDFCLACDCVECQRRSGSAFALGAFFPTNALTASGHSRNWTRIGSSGKPLTKHFCPDCGTTVFWNPKIRPDHRAIGIGCLTTPAPEPQNPRTPYSCPRNRSG